MINPEKTYYVAHKTENNLTQSVLNHCEGTSELAASFSSAFGAEEKGRLAGLLHDIGKYSEEFQNHILNEDHKKVDHSTAGAKEACNLGLYDIALTVAGHHSGIPDLGSRFDSSDKSSLMGRCKKTIPVYDAFRDELKFPTLSAADDLEFSNAYEYMYFVRMLFSCLVDADYLDTEAFMNGSVRSEISDSMSVLEVFLDTYYERLLVSPKGELNKIRCELFRRCLEKGQCAERGLYRLTLPTGAGKTLDTIAFAIKNALYNKHQRIIYVIPYTSIIDQTADVYKDIFGKKNVLEHHSDVEYSDDEDGYAKLLASENWDMPIVITTAVQFFESLYSYKPSKCRKLHNIANSIVIFDEAQTIPTPYLQPCLYAINQLYSRYNCTVVLSTATQPPFEMMFQKMHLDPKIKDICYMTAEESAHFVRCSIEDGGTISEDELLKKVTSHTNALVIFNTKKTALHFYEELSIPNKHYLSTDLMPVDRKRIIQQIKKETKDGISSIVVSTSLIEAGVDVDFPYVYREYCGIDSIIQSAGRCNREGKGDKTVCKTIHFKIEGHKPWSGIAQNIAASNYSLRSNDIAFSSDDYFKYLWLIKGENTDAKHILDLHEKGFDGSQLPFQEISRRFKLIDTQTYTIFIQTSDNLELINLLKYCEVITRTLIRKLSQYSVNVYPGTLKELLQTGSVELIRDEYYVLSDETLYDRETGLKKNVEAHAIIL